MSGLCTVTGNPEPYVSWMFCPHVCDNIYLSNVTSSDICQPVYNYGQNDTVSSDFVKSDVKYDDSGLYVCTAMYLDAAAAVYNVCVSVGKLSSIYEQSRSTRFLFCNLKGNHSVCVIRSFVVHVYSFGFYS